MNSEGYNGIVLVIYISRIYHDVPNSWELDVKFAYTYLQPEIPAHAILSQHHRVPGWASLHLSRDK